MSPSVPKIGAVSPADTEGIFAVAEVHDYPTHGVNVEYMDLQTLWNDRREPHANPLSSSPRREGARAPSASALGGMVEQIYRGQPTHRAGDE
jgi:hypothetical protein